MRGIIRPALDALGASDQEIVIGRSLDRLMIGFCGCALGFGDNDLFLAAYPAGVDTELSERNVEVLLGFFTRQFGKPLPWKSGQVPIWCVDIDTSYLEIHIELSGYKVADVLPVGPITVH